MGISTTMVWDAQAPPWMPVPLSAIDCVGAPPPGSTTTLADAVPLNDGWKTTRMLHEAPMASLSGQLDLSENCRGFRPCSVIECMGRTTSAVFLIVAYLGALVEPTATLPNPIAVGDNS
jgi:hypothetical protein